MSAPARHNDNRDWLGRFFARARRHPREDARRGSPPRPGAAEIDTTERALRSFAAGMAHELRTPLTALSGEIQLALRRQRSVGDYQEALARIAERVGELTEMTADLALLGEPSSGAREVSRVRVDALLAAVAARFHHVTDTPLAFEAGGSGARVAGDQARLARAIALVTAHAWRHRHPGARLRLKCVPPAAGQVAIVLEATPPGFLPHAWDFFARGGPSDRAEAPGQLRLRTAARIVADAGGSIDVRQREGVEVVHIRLPHV